MAGGHEARRVIPFGLAGYVGFARSRLGLRPPGGRLAAHR
jgi:hypothetical protein